MHMKGEGLLGRGIQLVKSYIVDLFKKMTKMRVHTHIKWIDLLINVTQAEQ